MRGGGYIYKISIKFNYNIKFIVLCFLIILFTLSKSNTNLIHANELNITNSSDYSQTYTATKHSSTLSSSTHSANAINQEYKITYKANQVTADNIIYWKTSKNNYTISDNQFEEPRFLSFYQWNTKADGTGINYLTNTNYNLNKPLTLYAQWNTVVTLQFTGVLGHVTKIVTSERTYNNPNTSTIIKCKPGTKIIFYHDNNRRWIYFDKNGSQHDFGKAESCYIAVPQNASGNASLHLVNKDSNTNNNNPPFEHFDYDHDISGWIQNCYPVLGT